MTKNLTLFDVDSAQTEESLKNTFESWLAHRQASRSKAKSERALSDESINVRDADGTLVPGGVEWRRFRHRGVDLAVDIEVAAGGEDAVAGQVPQVRTDGCRLAGDGRAGEAASREVPEHGR